jgi:hypothetical protein
MLGLAMLRSFTEVELAIVETAHKRRMKIGHSYRHGFTSIHCNEKHI